MDANAGPNHVALCQEVESELRELSRECRKKFPVIKEYTERAILKIRHHGDLVEQDPTAQVPDFPLDEVLRSILMACETFQGRIVLISLACLQRLIHRRVLKDETIAIVINLMKEQAEKNHDETVQVKVLQTIMSTPPHMTLLNELVVEQLLQLLYVLHNSPSAGVHHTATAGLRHIAECIADGAAAAAPAAAACDGDIGDGLPNERRANALRHVRPVVQQLPAALPVITPAQPPAALAGPLRIFYHFIQDLCVMSDHDATSLSTRYNVDPAERMRMGFREGFWLTSIKFPRPLCLELIGACTSAHPEVFTLVPECFKLLRQFICAVLIKNLRSCFDFAIMIRSIHLLQHVVRCPELGTLLLHELQVFLHLMLDLTTADRTPWQRGTALEFLRSVCEDPSTLTLLYHHGASPAHGSSPGDGGPRTFVELVNSLSKLMHQVIFSTGIDSGSLLQSATDSGPRASGVGGSPTPAAATRANSISGSLGGALLGGAALLGSGAALLSAGVVGGGESSAGGAGGTLHRSSGSNPTGDAPSPGPPRRSCAASRVKLLQLMSEAEPPPVQPFLIVSLVVDCLFAIVSTLYRLLLDASGEPVPVQEGDGGPLLLVGTPGQCRAAFKGPLSEAQEQCKGMLTDCWASLLSALSLLLHGTVDEAFLQQALRCLQTLLYCCGRLGLDQARDACLLQLSRYALPGQTGEDESEGKGSTTNLGMTTKNVLCFKAILNICHCYGALLGTAGWAIALRAFDGLEKVLQKAQLAAQAQLGPGHELTVLRQSLELLFETTAVLSEDALSDLIDAMGEHLRTLGTYEDGAAVLNRLVELCSFNLPRLLAVWGRIRKVSLELCMSERAELRGASAEALCRILAQALRKGALAMAERPEMAQEDLLRPLDALLRAPHDDVRARVCEGLLGILQASGQELFLPAWGTTIHLVAVAAQVELERVGLEFFLPKSLDAFSPLDNGLKGPREVAQATARLPAQSSAVLPVIAQLLDLLVHEFMEYVPARSVSRLTSSIGATARFTGLGLNSSLTAIGLLVDVADALARYHSAPQGAATNGSDAEPGAINASGTPDDLWIQIFMHLRVLAVDSRPEVRKCAVESLTSALLSHRQKVGIRCYQRCLREIHLKVLAEIRTASQSPSGGMEPTPGSEGIVVHHLHDSHEKQWAETLSVVFDGVRRVLSHFSDEAGVVAYAPLACSFLSQVQVTLQVLKPGVSGSALKALVDLMKIPASAESCVLSDEATSELGCSSGGGGSKPGYTASIWVLGWSVVWQLARFCLVQELQESLMEVFCKTLRGFRDSHKQVFTMTQHIVYVQVLLAMATSPSFYLPSSTPFKKNSAGENVDSQGNDLALTQAVDACAAEASGKQKTALGSSHPMICPDREVFEFVRQSPHELWNTDIRVDEDSKRAYTKAPVVVNNLINANQSRSLEVRSLDFGVTQACQGVEPVSEFAADFLGGRKSPTHRTMLHISSAKLNVTQSCVFGVLEDIQCFPHPALEVFFLHQLCALCLDVRRILRDSNKVALAARALCCIICFVRRVMFYSLTLLMSPDLAGELVGNGPRYPVSPSSAPPQEHIESLVGCMPHVCRVITALACGRGSAGLHESGIWKLALEALLYLVEDTLPALDRCKDLNPGVVAAYWDAVVSSLSEVAASSTSGPAGEGPEGESEQLLGQAIANLIVYRLLACKSVPASAAERAAHLLGDLAASQGPRCPDEVAKERAPGEEEPPAAANVREISRADLALEHLFNLCAAGGSACAAELAASAPDDVCNASVGAMTAHCSVVEGQPRPPLQLVDRAVLLRAAVPALLARVRIILHSYCEDEQRTGRPPCLPQRRVDELRLVLSRVKGLRVDGAAFAAAAPGLSDRARAACELAGQQGCAMLLMKQLAALASSEDASVRREAREVLEGLAGTFGL